MSDTTTTDWPEWVRYIASGIAGGVIMLVGVVRRWTRTERNSEEALAKTETHDKRIGDLEKAHGETSVRIEYMTKAIDEVRGMTQDIHRSLVKK